MLKIHGIPVSVHTRKVIVAALAKGLPREVVPVVPVIPGNPPPDWRRLSPTGKIPVLTDGGFTLPDSSAICAYLERCHPQPPLVPAAPQDHARALWLELGFSLEQVRGILQSPPGPAELRSMLLLRRSDVEKTLAAEQQRLRHIETRIAQLESDGHLSADDVVERAEPARQLLSLRRVVASFAEARTLIGELRERTQELQFPVRAGP
jgi:glutathione S-transferase